MAAVLWMAQHCQLIDDEVLASSNESAVALFFLSGAHAIPENQTLKIYNLNVVDIQIWNELQEVVIECQKHASLFFRS